MQSLGMDQATALAARATQGASKGDNSENQLPLH